MATGRKARTFQGPEGYGDLVAGIGTAGDVPALPSFQPPSGGGGGLLDLIRSIGRPQGRHTIILTPQGSPLAVIPPQAVAAMPGPASSAPAAQVMPPRPSRAPGAPGAAGCPPEG